MGSVKLALKASSPTRCPAGEDCVDLGYLLLAGSGLRGDRLQGLGQVGKLLVLNALAHDSGGRVLVLLQAVDDLAGVGDDLLVPGDELPDRRQISLARFLLGRQGQWDGPRLGGLGSRLAPPRRGWGGK